VSAYATPNSQRSENAIARGKSIIVLSISYAVSEVQADAIKEMAM